MKICFASYPAVTLTKGGPFIKMKEIKMELEKYGHKVVYYNMWNFDSNLNDFDIINLFGSNFAVYGFARSLKERKLKFLVEPIFFTRHSERFLRIINSADKFTRKIARGIWFDYGIIRDICNWSEIVTPNTTSEAEIISKGLSIPERKIEIINNGVSERFLNGDPDIFINKYGIRDFILYVGHLGFKRKNGHRLLKALAKINHPVVIIGNIVQAGESNEIFSEIEKNKNVILVEALENESSLLASAYAACNTFVLPSQFETPGIAALEAGLSGAKIVITPFGGTKDYFKDLAEYPDPYSIESIQSSIEKSLNKNKNDNLKEYIKNNFLWDKIAQRTIKVYEKSINT